MRAAITGTGSYLPEKILTNNDLEKMVKTSDEWITTRTGVKERRLAAQQEAASDLGAEAARRALREAGVKPEDVECLIVATVTGDMPFPSTACFIQNLCGLKNAAGFDIAAACSGYIYALNIAKSFIESRTYKKILVVAVDVLSRITDWHDRGTCVLFGDGAGAAVLEPARDDNGIISVYLGSDGAATDMLKLPGGGSRFPTSAETIKNKLHYIKMSGNKIFKLAVTAMIDSAQKAMALANLKCEDIKLLIPHQANIRIIEATAKTLKLPVERIFVNIQKYGNMSGATTAIGLDEAYRENRIKKGDYVELVAFGAGLTWGAAVIKWGIKNIA
ncbi:MAG: ketoacyl-ACP synthase III [Elusimicrobia bacterium]|nr:ketoacyl-ACP synthase III [Elusimicrobiota bacterium]